MPAGSKALSVVAKDVQLDPEGFKRALVALDERAASCEELGIAAQLRKAERCLHVGHVALPAGEGDVVLPCPGARFRERVFGLPVQRHEHEPVVQRIGIERARAPREGAAFGRGEVLHGMERERGEVGGRPRRHAAAHGAERMRRVGQHDHAVEGALQIGRRPPQVARAVEGGVEPVVVDHAAGDIDRDDGARSLGDEGGQGVVVHLVRSAGGVAQHGRGAHMADDRARGGVGVGARDHLVAGAHAERSQGAFEGGRRRRERRNAIRCRERLQLPLESLRFRTGGDPAAFQGIHHLVDLGLRDVGRRE